MINKHAAHGLTKEIAEEDTYGETYEADDVHRDEIVDRRGKKLQEHDYGAGTALAIDSIREAESQDHIDKRDIRKLWFARAGAPKAASDQMMRVMPPEISPATQPFLM